MSSNLKVNTILPSTGTTIGIGTVGGLINVVGNIDVNSTSGISTFNGLEISGIVTAKAGAAVTYYGDGSNLTGITDNVVTINNNADNRVITGSGTANTLEAESILTFSSKRLTSGGLSLNDDGVGGNIFQLYADDHNPWAFNIGNSTYHASSGLYGQQTNGGDFLLRMVGNSEYKSFTFEQYNGSSNRSWMDLGNGGNVVLKYQGATKIQTTSSGVTVTGGVTASTAAFSGEVDIADGEFLDFGNGGLKIRTNANNAYISEATSGKLEISASNLQLSNAGASQTYAYFTNGGSAALYHAGNASLQTAADGGVKATGNYIVTTAGRGLQFNASDSGSSEILDDYEEGSYVVTVTGSGGGSFALNPNSFRYTKIGRVVHVTGRIYVVSGSPTGAECQVSLPFNSSADIQSQDGRAYSYVSTYNAYSPNNDYQMSFSVLPNSGYGVLLWIVPNAAWQSVSPSSHMNQRNAYYGFDFSYTTAT